MTEEEKDQAREAGIAAAVEEALEGVRVIARRVDQDFADPEDQDVWASLMALLTAMLGRAVVEVSAEAFGGPPPPDIIRAGLNIAVNQVCEMADFYASGEITVETTERPN